MGEATHQQKRFVDIFLSQRKKNQGQAAIRAGYSKKSADAQASQLLKNPKVLRYMEEREKALENELREEFLFDAIEARGVMYKIMKDPDSSDRDRLNAAQDFLDRAGFKPGESVKLSGEVNTHNPFKDLTTEDLKKLANKK